LKPTPPPEAELVPLAATERKKGRGSGRKKQDGEEGAEQPEGKGKSWKRKGKDEESAPKGEKKGDKKGDKKGGKGGSEVTNGGSPSRDSKGKEKGKMGRNDSKGRMMTLEEIEGRMYVGGEDTKGKGKGKGRKSGKGKGKD